MDAALVLNRVSGSLDASLIVQYRWALTTGVGLLILLTLIGESLLGPGSGAPSSQDRLRAIQEKQREQLNASGGSGGFQGETTADVTLQPGEEGAWPCFDSTMR